MASSRTMIHASQAGLRAWTSDAGPAYLVIDGGDERGDLINVTVCGQDHDEIDSWLHRAIKENERARVQSAAYAAADAALDPGTTYRPETVPADRFLDADPEVGGF